MTLVLNWPRLFAMVRNEQVAAYGCEFEDGRCVIHSLRKNTLIIWNSMEELKKYNNGQLSFIYDL